MTTKRQLLLDLQQVDETDQPIGWFFLADLAAKGFRAVVDQHNEKLKRGIDCIPDAWFDLRQDLGKLHIPTFRKFHQILDGGQREISLELRKKGDFESYRQWLLETDPIRSYFHDLFYKERFPAFIPTKNRKRHCLLIGKSGSGKSEAIKLLALTSKLGKNEQIRRDCSLVLIDPHGDLAEDLVRQPPYFRQFCRGENDDELLYIDPTLGVSTKKALTINPFDVGNRSLTTVQRERTAQQLASVLKSLIGGKSTFTVNMDTLLLPCLSVLLQRPGSTLFDLLRFFDNDRNEDLVKLGCRSENRGHREFFENLFPQKRLDLTKGAIATKVQSLLNNQTFADLLAGPKSTVHLEEALSSGKSIIINCAAGRVGDQVSTAIGRFFVGMILAYALNRADQDQRDRKPVWLFIDEAQNFVSTEIKTILAEARKYALHLTLASQVVGQDMSPQLTKIVLGNTDVKIIGSAGADSIAAMRREMGAPEELFEQLQVGQFIVQCGSQPPNRVQFSDQYLHKAISPSDFRMMMDDQLDRYYQTNEREADGVTPESATVQPRFQDTNPFET